MNKILIGVLVVFTALGLGVGGAFAASRVWQAGGFSGASRSPVSAPSQAQQPGPSTGWGNPGWMGGGQAGNNTWMGPGMMGGYSQNANPTGNRLSMDQALQQVQKTLASYGPNFTVAEIMEFNSNFYAAILEKDSGHAAFELLVDPFSGDVFPEYGPNMMWNVKYGHMGNGNSPENSVSFEQARADAQTALDAQVPGAQVEPDGFSFYGYYTFDYKVKGQIAGMLSVNGFDGQTWMHTWHGQFIAEEEVEQ